MKTIYYHYFCDDDIGEADGFFDVVNGQLKLITAWSLNDANFRGEYMTPLFKYLGVNIQPLPRKHDKRAAELVGGMCV